jgi:S-adenosylmethionine hydrolase
LRLGRTVHIGDRSATFVRTFADVPAGDLLVYEDASRRLAIAVSGGDAAAALGVRPGDEIRLQP